MRVAVAGTFGPLHDGHRALFREALKQGDDGVLVAITSDELAVRTRHEPRPIPSFEERKESVKKELKELNEWGRDIEIQELHKVYGIASEDESIDALVVSPETADEVDDINQIRRKKGMEPIKGLIVPYVLAEDGKRISSTRIVKGEIDEHGNTVE